MSAGRQGIISQSLDKTPASVGYDLVQKNPNNKKFNKGPQDFELLFKGGSASKTASADKVLANFDSSLDRIYDDEIRTQTKASEDLDDRVLRELNGEMIKAIVLREGKIGYTTTEFQSEEDNQVVQTLLSGWSEARKLKDEVKNQAKLVMRKGTLDIRVKSGTETLEVYAGLVDGEEQWKPCSSSIKDDQIKASLYFLLDLHEEMPRFQDMINCEHQEGNYIFAYEKGVLEVYIADGSDPSALELSVIRDIKKLKL